MFVPPKSAENGTPTEEKRQPSILILESLGAKQVLQRLRISKFIQNYSDLTNLKSSSNFYILVEMHHLHLSIMQNSPQVYLGINPLFLMFTP